MASDYRGYAICSYCEYTTKWLRRHNCASLQDHEESCRRAYTRGMEIGKRSIQLPIPTVSVKEEPNVITLPKPTIKRDDDFSIKYDKKNQQYVGTVDSEAAKVMFTHKGKTGLSSMINNIIDLLRGIEL